MEVFTEEEIKAMRIRNGMSLAKARGKYVCRPAKFMFTEDLDDAHPDKFYLKKDGIHKTYTQVISEVTLYNYARRGISYSQVARDLGISPSTLYYSMRLNDGSNPRFRGTKDRYTKYMELYRKAKVKE